MGISDWRLCVLLYNRQILGSNPSVFGTSAWKAVFRFLVDFFDVSYLSIIITIFNAGYKYCHFHSHFMVVWGVPLFSPLGTQPSSLSNLFSFLLISLLSPLLAFLVCTCPQFVFSTSVCCYYCYLTVLTKYLGPFPLAHLWLPPFFYYGVPWDVCSESSIVYYRVV
jgi:hypothetical protein